MRNCAGVCSRGTLHRYCSSRISGGTLSARQTSFTTIETKRYSSGRKNTLANIGKPIDNLTERTSRWSRRHFRSALPNPGCLRSPRMGNCGGRRAAMYGDNRGGYLKRARSTAPPIAWYPASWGRLVPPLYSIAAICERVTGNPECIVSALADCSR